MYMRNDYDARWGNKSYSASHNARLALSEQRPLESAINAYFSAKMAYDLYAVTKNSFWSKRAKKGYSSFLAYARENLDDFDESWLEIATNTLNFLRKKELGKRGEGGRNGKYNRRRRIDYL